MDIADLKNSVPLLLWPFQGESGLDSKCKTKPIFREVN